jgi:aminoglycoside 6'-N-acetyltransferase I
LPILTQRATVSALSLAPLAVLPEWQKQGIGSALVRRGLERCREAGHSIVVVLGHHDFYPRFGFSSKLAELLAAPFTGRESWMALELKAGALDGIVGWVQYPPPFAIEPHVRPAFKPDQSEWLRMRAALWPDAGPGEHAREIAAFFDTGSLSWSESFLAEAVFVATRPAGGLCGFVEASIRWYAEECEPRPVGYLEGWYVDPDMRRLGIGKKLARAAEAWSSAQACSEMASDAHIENATSHAAHRALGFDECSRLVHFRKRLGNAENHARCRPGRPRVTLSVVDGRFGICKSADRSVIPAWALESDLFSITRTPEEVSVVCRQQFIPEGAVSERDWCCLRVAGAMPLTVTGILSSITAPLAKGGVSVFAVSTFNTDYLLVKSPDLQKAIRLLKAAGHTVEISGGASSGG